MSDPVPLGKLIEGEAERDAVHVAIVPMTATRELEAGDHVNAKGEPFAPFVGIVDPFLKEGVDVGDRFYVCLYPNSVTGMRHHWQHPAFQNLPVGAQAFDRAIPKSQFDEAVVELSRYARGCCVSYERLMEIIDTGHRGRDEMVDRPMPGHIWDLWETVTGKTADEGRREEYWSCAC